MKHYFIEMTASYITKNKAHEAIQKFAFEFNNTLADENEKNNIKEALKSRLDEINKAFPRCHDIQFSGWIHENETIAVDGNFMLTFKEIKHYKLTRSSQLVAQS